MSGAALNLSHLAHLLLKSGIPMAICHGKRDAYLGGESFGFLDLTC
jgi:hypothetical protein